MMTNNILIGFRALIEAIKAGKEVEKVLIKKGLTGDLYQETFELIKEHKIAYQLVPIEKLDRITRKNHQGIIAFVAIIEYSSIENLIPMLFEKGENPIILVLDQISDVRNFGAIARSAECAGVHGIVIPEKGVAQINFDALKTSAGALLKIPVCRVQNLYRTVNFLKNSGLKIFSSTEKAQKNIFEADFTQPLAIIMGSEDTGISNDLLNITDEKVKIPLQGTIESLNVSVATSIVCFEVVRQRNFR